MLISHSGVVPERGVFGVSGVSASIRQQTQVSDVTVLVEELDEGLSSVVVLQVP